MIYVINQEPELELYIQDVSLDKSSKLRAGAQYVDVSIGDKFDCVIELDKGSIIKTIEIEVNSIMFKGESVLQLPKGRSGEIGLSTCVEEYEWLKGILRTKKVLLSRKDNIEFNIYSKNVISLESAKNNNQVQKMLPRLGLETSNYDLLFIAKAIQGDISIDEEFDVIWNMDNIGIIESNPLRIKAIYSKNLQLEKMLYSGVPTLVLLSKSNDEILCKEDLSLLNSQSNHLMIGKRVTPVIYSDNENDLPS